MCCHEGIVIVKSFFSTLSWVRVSIKEAPFFLLLRLLIETMLALSPGDSGAKKRDRRFGNLPWSKSSPGAVQLNSSCCWPV